jgi:hypothetical protein
MAGKMQEIVAIRRQEKSVFDAILNNHLLLAAIILLLLLLVPLVVMKGHKLRNSSHSDRRKHPRGGVDRRA